MLEQCEVKREVFAGMLERLREFAEPYMRGMVRSEQREHTQRYLGGLLSDLERKNVESIAYLHDQDRKGLQHFIREGSWGHGPLLEVLAGQVRDGLGEEDGVLVFDPSGHAKRGTESVGVQRQWCGRLGKIENCQVGIYMGYVSGRGHALVDTRLYLPGEWARDRKRRRKAGVPREVPFRTRHAMALEMLQEKGRTLPHAWIAGDAEMGRSGRFRGALRESGETYLLAVPSNTTLRDLEGEVPPWSGQGRKPKRRYERADVWCRLQPQGAWTRIDIRNGEKGPIVIECLKKRVQARTENRRVGPEELFFATRERQSDGSWKHDYGLSNAASDTPLEELARVANAEHRIEHCIQRSKSEAGMSHYEVRTWTAWHHHQALSILATWFLVTDQMRGEKTDARDHRPADPDRPRSAVA
jgi:SRSO17 transposase